MNLVVLLPAVVAAVGLVLVTVAIYRVLDETRGLRRGLVDLSQLTPALVEIREAGAEMRRSAGGLRRP